MLSGLFWCKQDSMRVLYNADPLGPPRKVPPERHHDSRGILLIGTRNSLCSWPRANQNERQGSSPWLSSLLIQGQSRLRWRCFQDESRRRTLSKTVDARCCLGQRAAAARAHQWTPLALDLDTSHLAAIVFLHIQLLPQRMHRLELAL